MGNIAFIVIAHTLILPPVIIAYTASGAVLTHGLVAAAAAVEATTGVCDIAISSGAVALLKTNGTVAAWSRTGTLKDDVSAIAAAANWSGVVAAGCAGGIVLAATASGLLSSSATMPEWIALPENAAAKCIVSSDTERVAIGYTN